MNLRCQTDSTSSDRVIKYSYASTADDEEKLQPNDLVELVCYKLTYECRGYILFRFPVKK